MAGFPLSMDEEASGKMFKDLEGFAHMIVCKADGGAAGYLEIRPFGEEDKDEALRGKNGYALSYAMTAPYRRQGLTAEALRAAIDELFSQPDCDFINAGFFSFNEASRHLQEKLGFQYYCTHTIQRDGQDIETIENILYRPRK